MIQYDIVHPTMPLDGVNPEDCFLARDTNGLPMGSGYIVPSRKPHLFPDCPNNLYLSLNSNSIAEYGLLGALMGRAAVLRSTFPQNEPVRIYTMLPWEKSENQQEFYRHNEFDLSITEDVFTIQPDQGTSVIPPDCSIMAASLNMPAERSAFLGRMAANDVTNLSPAFLAHMLQAPHVAALGLFRSGRLAGECLAVGSGNECEILGIYIDPAFRHQGLGTLLMRQTMLVLQKEAVDRFYFRSISASQPQRKLLGKFSPVLRNTVSVLPSKRIDRV